MAGGGSRLEGETVAKKDSAFGDLSTWDKGIKLSKCSSNISVRIEWLSDMREPVSRLPVRGP